MPQNNFLSLIQLCYRNKETGKAAQKRFLFMTKEQIHQDNSTNG